VTVPRNSRARGGGPTGATGPDDGQAREGGPTVPRNGQAREGEPTVPRNGQAREGGPAGATGPDDGRARGGGWVDRAVVAVTAAASGLAFGRAFGLGSGWGSGEAADGGAGGSGAGGAGFGGAEEGGGAGGAIGAAWQQVLAEPRLAAAVAAAVILVSAVGPALLLRAPRRRPRLATAVRLAVHVVGALLLVAIARDGFVALLSVTLPAPPDPALLLVPVALVWVGAAAGTEVALAAAPSARVAVLLPTGPAWLYGILLGPLTPLDAGLVLLAAGCVALQLIRAVPPPPRHPADTTPAPATRAGTTPRPAKRGSTTTRAAAVRRRVGAVVFLAVLAGVAAGAGPAAVGAVGPRHRVDPREALGTVPLPASAANPLDWVDVWLTDPGRRLFAATTDGPVPFWRLAVLTDFDGQQWSPPPRYARAGLGVPPGGAGATQPVGGTDAAAVKQTVTVDGLAGPFLPAMERPVRIGAPVTAVDAGSGVLLTDRAELRGLRYTVVSAGRGPGGDGSCGSGNAVPPPPEELGEALAAVAGGRCEGAFAPFAQAVERRLNTGRFNTAGAPSAGTNVGVLGGFLQPGGRGTVVEFAAGLALALRAAGVPTRLVIGFAPQEVPAGQPQEVYARDVRLWVDAWLPGSGWTAYHPAPPAPTDAAVAPAPVTSPQPRVTPSPQPSPSASPVSSEPPGPPDDPSGLAHLRLALVLVAALLAGYALVVTVAPWRRRRRRRRLGGPRVRGLAAWHDVLDALGYAPARHATPAELLAATPASIGRLLADGVPDARDAVGALTATAERCLFTPVAPGEDEVRAAWRAARVIRRQLYRRAAYPGRIRRALSPANLRSRPVWQPPPDP
jgi:hypothetical protein